MKIIMMKPINHAYITVKRLRFFRRKENQKMFVSRQSSQDYVLEATSYAHETV